MMVSTGLKPPLVKLRLTSEKDLGFFVVGLPQIGYGRKIERERG
jgi:hypothetical protein